MYAAWKGIPIEVRRGAYDFITNPVFVVNERNGVTLRPPMTLRSYSCCPFGALLNIFGAAEHELMPGSGWAVIRWLLDAQRGQTYNGGRYIVPFLDRLDDKAITAFMKDYDAGKIKDLKRAMGA